MSTPIRHEVSLIADPIHQYIQFTVPSSGSTETTEKDLIDSPWVQRLRYLYQLQSARWVYPAAEHSRFQHSLGAMHLAGRYAKHVYPSLAKTVRRVPSLPYVEELLRVTALLHDVGHGPFCHFFDHHVLRRFGLSHELMGTNDYSRRIRRNDPPSAAQSLGNVAKGETLNPEHVAFLILKDPNKRSQPYPRWLQLLPAAHPEDCSRRTTLITSCATPTCVGWPSVPSTFNDSFTTRLITPKGLTLHKNGLPALQMFLNARLYLYANVYYHRTTRAPLTSTSWRFFTTPWNVFFRQPPAPPRRLSSADRLVSSGNGPNLGTGV